MKNKSIKFILKSTFFFPIGFFFWILVSGFEITNWITPVIAGYAISLIIVFWQLFDYEKYNNLIYVDFLESKHSLRIDNTQENWKKINQMIKNPFTDLKILEKTESCLRIQIKNRFIDSILNIDKTGKDIQIDIKKKFLGFLPDNARNYQTLNRIASFTKH